MKEYGALFKKEMIQAILREPPEIPKTQTRRLNAPWEVGDHLWVKVNYFTRRIDSPAILEVIGKRQERLQEITEEDAIAEGVTFRDGKYWFNGYPFFKARPAFIALWDSINAKPKPVCMMIGGDAISMKVISHYVSYPWEDGQKIQIHRGKEWFVIGNPEIEVTEFKRIK